MKRLIRLRQIIALVIIIGITGVIKAYPQGIIELSLEDVTELALENSLDIQIAKFDAYIKRTSQDKAESIFDTILSAEASYDYDKKMQSSTLAGSYTKEHSFSLGLEKKLPTGTTLSLDATNTKKRTDSIYAALNPYHEAEAEFTVKQSLGKNFFGLADRADIKVTRIDIENSDFTSLDKIEGDLFAVQESYWNFVLKDTELAIKKDMLKKAEVLFAIYKDKSSLGLVEESELLAIEALVFTRKSEVDIAALERETAKNNLLFLINQGGFKTEIRPKNNLFCSADTVDLYEVLNAAVQNRRDYKRIKNELKRNKINVVVRKNALWPEIDLEASFARNNLASDRSSAWEDFTKGSNDEIFFKLSFKVPLENREAKAEFEKINLEAERLLLRLKRLERLILQEINDKVNNVNTMQIQVKLFEQTVKIHTKKLDKQISRLEFGRSDADTLIRYEEDLLGARLSLATYLFRYRRSLIELDLAENSLLDKYWKEPL